MRTVIHIMKQSERNLFMLSLVIVLNKKLILIIKFQNLKLAILLEYQNRKKLFAERYNQN